VIRLQRTPTPPRGLHRAAARETLALCAAREQYYRDFAAYTAGPGLSRPTRPNAKSGYYAHNDVKETLLQMSGRRCFYCGTHLRVGGHLRVDHFRPQAIYPKLAYEWSNLLGSCEICNERKRAQFPLQGQASPTEDPIQPCSRDDGDPNLLLNPCVDDPDDHFDFVGPDLVCRTARAHITCMIADLNREELVSDREMVFQLFRVAVNTFRLALASGIVADIAESGQLLKRSLASGQPYPAMKIAHLRSLGIDPASL
jgi:uncharacterized protein (TIGR02646 family)